MKVERSKFKVEGKKERNEERKGIDTPTRSGQAPVAESKEFTEWGGEERSARLRRADPTETEAAVLTEKKLTQQDGISGGFPAVDQFARSDVSSLRVFASAGETAVGSFRVRDNTCGMCRVDSGPKVPRTAFLTNFRVADPSSLSEG
jgi:hypothetical protein